jgi:hypothetical protein
MMARDAVGLVRRFSVCALITTAACGTGQGVATSQAAATVTPQAQEFFVFAVGGTPDSAVALAKFALGSIDGSIGLPRITGKTTNITAHYTRPRHGGGTREVAIIAAVDRASVDAKPTTLVELAIYGLDLEQSQSYAQRRARATATPLSQNAPALKRPILLTPRDTLDWRLFEVVLDAMTGLGARRR